MVFVYPVQRLLVGLGVTDAFWLVAAARLVIAAIAGCNVWLIYRVGLRLFGGPRIALLAAALFVSNHLQMAFGSAELPRIVAAGFFLAAFGVLLTPGVARCALAGVLIGIGASLRFGEMVFVVPALWTTWAARDVNGQPHPRRWLRVAVLLGVSAATLLVVIGVSDALYWGRPFHSLIAITDYTLVDRLSSRGYQPPWFYLTQVASWSNVLIVVLALLWRANLSAPALAWAVMPTLLLSALPHKEPRYLIATIPFWALAAAPALSSLLSPGREEGFWLSRRRIGAVATVLVLAAALAFDASKYRFVRSEDAVRIAWMMNGSGARGLVAEQLWRFGGRLYVPDLEPLLEIDLDRPDALPQLRTALCSRTAAWAALRAEHENPQTQRVLDECGMSPVSVPRDGGYRVYRRR
jgi:hypothetical protein